MPWEGILSSLPVWTIVIAHIGCFWGYATILSEIPSYLYKILGTNIQEVSQIVELLLLLF